MCSCSTCVKSLCCVRGKGIRFKAVKIQSNVTSRVRWPSSHSTFESGFVVGAWIHSFIHSSWLLLHTHKHVCRDCASVRTWTRMVETNGMVLFSSDHESFNYEVFDGLSFTREQARTIVFNLFFSRILSSSLPAFCEHTSQDVASPAFFLIKTTIEVPSHLFPSWEYPGVQVSWDNAFPRVSPSPNAGKLCNSSCFVAKFVLRMCFYASLVFHSLRVRYAILCTPCDQMFLLRYLPPEWFPCIFIEIIIKIWN